MIQLIKLILTNTVKNITIATLFLGLVMSVSSHSGVLVSAQDSGTQSGQTTESSIEPGLNVFGSLGFNDCRIVQANSGPDGEQLQRCVVQIVQFFFVVALFVVALRIAVESLSGLNPFNSGKAIDNSIKLIQDIIIGLLLLGSPAVLLTLFSTTTLNIQSILNLGRGESTSQTTNTSGNNTTNNGSNTQQGTPQTPSVSVGAVTANGQSVQVGTNQNQISDAATRQAYINQIENITSNLLNGVELDGINENAVLDDVITAIDQSGVYSSNSNTTSLYKNLLQFNKTIAGSNFTKIPKSNSYSISNPSCNSEASAECNYNAQLVNTNNGCDGIFDSNEGRILENTRFPSASCYFVEKDAN